MIPLVTIEGPTASGKSRLALELASVLETEIISADSRQVYRGMDIGTAKASSEEQKRVPHHLIDIVEPSESYNVGRFCVDAAREIEALWSRGKIPLICGGTGLYVNALFTGLFEEIEVPPELREGLSQRLQSEGLEVLYDELTRTDPGFAAKVSVNDRQRVLRGLEVFLASGISISEHWQKQSRKEAYTAFRILINPPRETLYERINARVLQMLENGLLEEIKTLFARGFGPESPGLNSVGYKEYFPHLLGSAPLQDCVELAAQHTRNYAKRQCTWYRKYWFDLTLASPECIISEIASQIEAWQKTIQTR
ncbi:MAG: tRNA (adenosine(37)-N6)-dimethylallyltransferase MiaA [Candidatus Cloacimonetes bacterium]|jgi:tRNA dimethylallyltransferase|nr:tRNA (adenosine(37)-N6)-dimethylallyltransferase MiaA [Candidatus Cloacimonadota bacterium]